MPSRRARSTPLRYAVMPAQCETCIFGPNSPIREGRLAEIQAYLLKGVSHICHHPALHGKPQKVACRGARDWQLLLWYRMGILPEPTDRALEVAMTKRGILWPN